MAPLRSYLGKLALVFLIGYGLLASQGAWVSAGHGHHRGAEHCCAVCHAGHLPLVEAVSTFNFQKPYHAGWFHFIEERQQQQDAWIVLGQSRAPPALSVL